MTTSEPESAASFGGLEAQTQPIPPSEPGQNERAVRVAYSALRVKSSLFRLSCNGRIGIQSRVCGAALQVTHSTHCHAQCSIVRMVRAKPAQVQYSKAVCLASYPFLLRDTKQPDKIRRFSGKVAQALRGETPDAGKTLFLTLLTTDPPLAYSFDWRAFESWWNDGR